MKIVVALTLSLLILVNPLSAHEARDCDLSVFCFEIVRTFNKPVIFSFDKMGEENMLLVKVYSGQGGYDWGQVETRLVRELEDKQVAKLEQLLAAALNLPDSVEGGLDGSMWYLTVPRHGSYLRVGYWTPTYKPEDRQLQDFYNFGMYLWEISKVTNHDVGDLY